MRRLILGMLLAAAIALGLVLARNQPDVDEQAVNYRQALMTVIDRVSQPLFLMQHGQRTYDGAELRKAALQLTVLSGMIGDAFARDTRSAQRVPTAALPYVWTDAPAFNAAVQRMQSDAATLQQVASSADIARVALALSAVDSDCAQCHRQFRAD